MNLEWILRILSVIIVLPILVFLCVKLGTVGYFRGKEIAKRQNEFDSVQNDEIEN